MNKYFRFFLISFFIIFIDQISKFYLVETMNYGAAFGILQGARWFLSLVGVIAVVVILFYLSRVKGDLIEIGMAILFGGVIGNLIDRLLLGGVRDFISIWIWPSFNIADSANCLGVGLIIYWLWKNSD